MHRDLIIFQYIAKSYISLTTTGGLIFVNKPAGIVVTESLPVQWTSNETLA